MLFSSHKDHQIRMWRFSVFDRDIRYKKAATLPKRSTGFSFKQSRPHPHANRFSCLAYHQTKGLLYTGSHDKTVRVWRVTDSTCVDTFLKHEDCINAIVVNQDDGYVVTCSSDGLVKIWWMVYNEGSHTLTMRLRFEESPVNVLTLSLSLYNYFLYSGSSDGAIDFWEKEMTSYRFRHAGFPQGHRFTILCLETIGRLVFSGSEDTTIRIWKREEGSCIHECLAVMHGYRGPVICLAACIEMDKVMERYLVYSASLNQTFKVWRIKVLPDEKVLYLCKAEEGSVNDDHNLVIKDGLVDHYYEMSPVLSPSWVEKKRQGGYF